MRRSGASARARRARGSPRLAERPVAVHGRKQRRHEAVARPDGVDDVDFRRRDRDPLAAEHGERPLVAKRRDRVTRPEPRPGAEALFDGPAGVEPLEVLLARLDDMGERGLPLGEARDRLAIRRHQGAGVRIVAHRRMRARGGHRGEDPLAVPRVERRNRADMQVRPPPPAMRPETARGRRTTSRRGRKRSASPSSPFPASRRRASRAARPGARIRGRRRCRRGRRPAPRRCRPWRFGRRRPSRIPAAKARSPHCRATRRARRRRHWPSLDRGSGRSALRRKSGSSRLAPPSAALSYSPASPGRPMRPAFEPSALTKAAAAGYAPPCSLKRPAPCA